MSILIKGMRKPDRCVDFGETNGYKPRQPGGPKMTECDGQMSLFDMGVDE